MFHSDPSLQGQNAGFELVGQPQSHSVTVTSQEFTVQSISSSPTTDTNSIADGTDQMISPTAASAELNDAHPSPSLRTLIHSSSSVPASNKASDNSIANGGTAAPVSSMVPAMSVPLSLKDSTVSTRQQSSSSMVILNHSTIHSSGRMLSTRDDTSSMNQSSFPSQTQLHSNSDDRSIFAGPMIIEDNHNNDDSNNNNNSNHLHHSSHLRVAEERRSECATGFSLVAPLPTSSSSSSVITAQPSPMMSSIPPSLDHSAAIGTTLGDQTMLDSGIRRSSRLHCPLTATSARSPAIFASNPPSSDVNRKRKRNLSSMLSDDGLNNNTNSMISPSETQSYGRSSSVTKLQGFAVDGLVPEIDADSIVPKFPTMPRKKYRSHQSLSNAEKIALRREQNREAAKRARAKKAKQRQFLDEQMKYYKQELSKLRQQKDDASFRLRNGQQHGSQNVDADSAALDARIEELNQQLLSITEERQRLKTTRPRKKSGVSSTKTRTKTTKKKRRTSSNDASDNSASKSRRQPTATPPSPSSTLVSTMTQPKRQRRNLPRLVTDWSMLGQQPSHAGTMANNQHQHSMMNHSQLHHAHPSSMMPMAHPAGLMMPPPQNLFTKQSSCTSTIKSDPDQPTVMMNSSSVSQQSSIPGSDSSLPHSQQHYAAHHLHHHPHQQQQQPKMESFQPSSFLAGQPAMVPLMVPVTAAPFATPTTVTSNNSMNNGSNHSTGNVNGNVNGSIHPSFPGTPCFNTTPLSAGFPTQLQFAVFPSPFTPLMHTPHHTATLAMPSAGVNFSLPTTATTPGTGGAGFGTFAGSFGLATPQGFGHHHQIAHHPHQPHHQVPSQASFLHPTQQPMISMNQGRPNVTAASAMVDRLPALQRESMTAVHPHSHSSAIEMCHSATMADIPADPAPPGSTSSSSNTTTNSTVSSSSSTSSSSSLSCSSATSVAISPVNVRPSHECTSVSVPGLGRGLGNGSGIKHDVSGEAGVAIDGDSDANQYRPTLTSFTETVLSCLPSVTDAELSAGSGGATIVNVNGNDANGPILFGGMHESFGRVVCMSAPSSPMLGVGLSSAVSGGGSGMSSSVSLGHSHSSSSLDRTESVPVTL